MSIGVATEQETDMTLVEHLAAWIVRATSADLSEEAREALKIRVLDAFGLRKRCSRWTTQSDAPYPA
ncbi:MAG TPA: hypothetical protein VFV38_02815 [Ktedonobacteraceae bacterium]|nr:hypothetical protein [Ktedonobacteraceae bacterium]